jgi:hypothetical protein
VISTRARELLFQKCRRKGGGIPNAKKGGVRPHGVNRASAFTVIEFLTVLATLAILFGLILLLHGGGREKGKAPRVQCTATLKQLTLGLILWANENEARFPMEVSVSAGGSKEHALAGNIVPNFTVAAAQIGDHRVLICPSDKKRKQAKTFGTLTSGNISYFLNADASWKVQEQILAGDRDVAMSNAPAPAGLLPIADADALSWANILHKGGGNVGLVDGSVYQLTTRDLRRLFTNGITTRLVIP